MSFWWALARLVIVSAISYFLTPTPKNNQPKAAGLGDFTGPTAEEGRKIPVLFGTRDLAAPNVTWYGDLKVEPIRKSGGKK